MTEEQKERNRARIAEIERETADGFSLQIHKAFGAGFESGTEEGRALALDAERGSTSWQMTHPGIYECTRCGQHVFTPDIVVYRYCHGCGRRVISVLK